jgi:hypothetical protein
VAEGVRRERRSDEPPEDEDEGDVERSEAVVAGFESARE